MSNEIKKRERPILTVACPICDSVFSVTALHSDFIGDDAEENERIIRELTDYAMQGMNIRVVDKPQDYNFNYCEHVKNRERYPCALRPGLAAALD